MLAAPEAHAFGSFDPGASSGMCRAPADYAQTTEPKIRLLHSWCGRTLGGTQGKRGPRLKYNGVPGSRKSQRCGSDI
eukprot:6188644-Pleurochrysis_carterae.AAC.2